MVYLVTSVPFFLAFAISFSIEQRRLINGVLLLIALFFVAVGVLFELLEIPWLHDRVDGTLLTLVFFLGLFVVLPLFLLGNGVLMFRREGRRLGNLLSLLAGLGIFAFLPLLLVVDKGVTPRWVDKVIVAIGIVLGYLCLVFAAYLVYSIVYGRVPHRSGVDFVVVHGSRLIRGKVPPLLASRLDRARIVFDRESARGNQPMIITSGGQGGDEDQPEARAMADYLIEAGVPEERILLEDRSTTTRENLVNSREMMIERLPGYRAALVTNNFHAFRTALVARREKVNGYVVGSRTAWYYLPSATIREFVGILRDHLILNAVVVVVLVAAYLFWPR